MHDCPECGGSCDCDQEDHHQSAPADCSHNCPEDNDDDDYDDDSDARAD